ncbi:polyamine-modulated factor 1-binding protein 1 [Orycteropus afer afer]|uniref:Polyamine-modulated factor 1-binding protein 1 n=1 Tax=Orycteropus afer afer TaxID=1230840 RepID=A0A8B6ZSC5_ORYAF|nr:polyamine-modulated factor 1-binding protein 1 [Orycteropus afer afer]
MGERDREVSSLNKKLLNLQTDIKNLHDVCKRQGRTLQENQLCEEDEMMTSSQVREKQALALEESEVEFGSSKQCHLRQLHQLKTKLLALQQELEFRTEELQTSYCSLLQYQSILEKQTCDLVQLHHHCKLKEDEVILYEEEMGSHNENTEKLHMAQEQLALAGDKIVSLERSLNLYRDKYQASLSNIELLECQVKMLEGELNGIVGQEPENKGDHPKVRICSTPCVIQDHQETLKRLSEVWQKVYEQDDLIQELRNKLACSNALVLEREESLIKLQADFVSFKATHRHPPCSSGDCEDIKKMLKHLQEQKASQCLHVEEYQNLVKELKIELEEVSEQKKNVMKDMMKLELELHTIREEMSAQIERKDKEASCLHWRLQEMEWRFCEIQKSASEKDKALQEKDERLNKLEKELAQARDALKNKEMELQKQQVMATEPKVDGNQDKSAQFQKLKDSLEEARKQQKLIAQQATQYKEQAFLAESKLEESQRKLQSSISLDRQKEDTIQELQNSLQKQQRELLMAKEQLASNREQVDELTSELCKAKKLFEISNKENNQLKKTVEELEMKLRTTLENMKQIQHQNKEQASTKDNLEEELQEVKRLLEEKRGQLKKSKEQEKMLEEELESLRQEERRKEKMSKENLRKLEEKNENLQAELLHYSTQLDISISKHSSTQQTVQELNKEVSQQKETITTLQAQLDKAKEKEKHCIQTMVSKAAYDELSLKAATCQEDLTQALQKLNQAAAETKDLHRSLMQTQERKTQLEDEIAVYEERMKKLNVELKKLQGFHQQSELEVHVFDKKLEEMTSQVLQWKRQHKNDLKMLAAKEEQLMEFQVEMATLKEKLLEDEKPCCVPQVEVLRSTQHSVPKENYRLHRENDQIMTNMEQWAKEQKIANEKLGSKLREQVKYIAKLTGEKDHLHNVMEHLQQENKKLKSEMEEKKLNAGQPKLHSKPPGFLSKMEPLQRERKMCGAMGWRGMPQELGQRMDSKLVGMPHYSAQTEEEASCCDKGLSSKLGSPPNEPPLSQLQTFDCGHFLCLHYPVPITQALKGECKGLDSTPPSPTEGHLP